MRNEGTAVVRPLQHKKQEAKKTDKPAEKPIEKSVESAVAEAAKKQDWEVIEKREFQVEPEPESNGTWKIEKIIIIALYILILGFTAYFIIASLFPDRTILIEHQQGRLH